MGTQSQKRAIENYRMRLAERGLARFEVLGLEKDRELIRKVARHLAEDSAGAAQVRNALSLTIKGTHRSKGGILAALRRSPFVGAEIPLDRPRISARNVEL